MALVNLTLEFDSLNDFIQVGDTVYYSHSFGAPLGGFEQTALSNTRRLGLITNISGNFIDVQYDNAATSPPAIGDFIYVVKDKIVNTSSLLGYYMEAKFKNTSSSKAELFSIGSEFSESSQ
tara:strand:+ start:88 stop:450 length:363 start_codon:yes stop_codon:yes gene_type:complete